MLHHFIFSSKYLEVFILCFDLSNFNNIMINVIIAAKYNIEGINNIIDISLYLLF